MQEDGSRGTRQSASVSAGGGGSGAKSVDGGGGGAESLPPQVAWARGPATNNFLALRLVTVSLATLLALARALFFLATLVAMILLVPEPVSKPKYRACFAVLKEKPLALRAFWRSLS